MPETRDVELHILLENPTPGVMGGIQYGSGSKAVVKDWQKMSGPEAVFIAIAQILKTPSPPTPSPCKQGEGVQKSAKSRSVLTGPVIQKDGKGRFIYIVWRDHSGVVSRRAKIYVESIDQAMIVSGQPLEIHLPGRANDGLPCCATVKPLQDWRTIGT